ncbi:unnamed protein product [Caenorhabditis nigoni]
MEKVAAYRRLGGAACGIMSSRRSSSRRSSSRSSTRGSSRKSHENRRSRSRSSSDRSYSPSQHRRKNRRHSSTSSKSSRRSGNDSGDRLSFGHTPRSSEGSRLGPVSPSEYNIDFNKNFEYAGDDVSNLEPVSPTAYWNGDRHANGNNNNSRSPGPYNPIGSISSSSSSSSSSSRASSLARSIPLGDIMPVAGENNHLENRRMSVTLFVIIRRPSQCSKSMQIKWDTESYEATLFWCHRSLLSFSHQLLRCS